ncbi:hypothetical protein CF336_g6488 [Tilletia laevis]|uniref:INO80 complex subunit B-like conserved region domain-containing protein n=4 Tax=Tilletia TaxID=13289 RepID=A0ABN7IIC2_9BASI|nr:hypothetical protein CF336_g6488 [Tilletia laevis]CAD6901613.1 unnamed protein product [Tilletia caries]
MPRAPSSTKTAKKNPATAKGARHDPLHAQLREDDVIAKYGTVSAPGRRKHKKHTPAADGDDQPAAPVAMISGATSAGSLQRSSYIDPRLSRNILRLAREQQDEIDREQAGPAQPQPPQASSSSSLARIRHSKADMPEDDDDDDDNVPQRRTADDHEDDDDDDDFPEDAGEDEEVYEELEIDPSDTQLLARLGAAAADHDDEHDLGAGGARRGGSSLADMIMAKIEEADKISGGGKVTFKAGSLDEPGEQKERPMPPGINPKVIEVYTK